MIDRRGRSGVSGSAALFVVLSSSDTAANILVRYLDRRCKQVIDANREFDLKYQLREIVAISAEPMRVDAPVASSMPQAPRIEVTASMLIDEQPANINTWFAKK
jgi:hypothetical protein